jgi:hypothetical protein
MKKRGQITAKQFIALIILVLGIVLILILWASLNWKPTITKEICHESVVYRGSVNVGPFQTSKIVPLKCKTEKICLTDDDDCKQYGELNKDNPVTKVELSEGNEREEILDVLSDAMFDCHSILGEGKVLYMPYPTFDEKYCVICSRIAFDEKTIERLKNEEFKDISYGEVYKNLQSKKTNQGKTYLEFIHPGWEDWNKVKEVFSELKTQENSPEQIKKLNFDDWTIKTDFENGYAIVASISPDSIWASYGGTAAAFLIAGFGTAISLTGVGAPIGVSMIAISSTFVGTTAGGITLAYTHPGGEDFVSIPPSIQPFSEESLNSLGCTSFENAP